MDLALRLHLGRELAQSAGLAAEDALRWILALPETTLRTLAVRCFEELVVLWRERFAQKYPNGLAVTARNKLEVAYSASSRAFELPIVQAHDEYIDILSAKAPLGKLGQLLEECTDALDAYSRAVGRNPLARTTIDGAALLPPELQNEALSVALENFKWGVAAVMGERSHATSTARTLLDIAGLEIGDEGKIAASAADELGRALDRLNLAIEPDRRYGTGVPHADELVYLFKADRGGPIDPDRAPVRSMRMVIEVAILAATVDGEISIDELESVFKRVKADSALSPIERARLCAFAADTYRNPPKLAGLKRRLLDAPLIERKAYAKTAITTLGAGAAVDAKEIAFLEKFYKLLGLPKEDVYKHVHGQAAAASIQVPTSSIIQSPPIAVKPAALPTRKLRDGIDLTELHKKRRDTEGARKLLGDLLSDGADAVPITPPIPANDTSELPGLDLPYAELLILFGPNGSMTRSEFDRKAKDRRLLPGAAIDRINEWAIETLDEPLFEDEGDFVIPPHLLGRIAELRRKAA